MTTEELGRALTEARIARGLTLHDVERDTRISQGYLKALEEGNLEVLPAPVYARAFMRTYAQYLGLNARALVQRMPGARPEPELPPLPELGREATAPLISANWIAAALVLAVLLGLGVLLFWNRGGEEAAVTSQPPPASEVVGEGAEQPAAPGDAPAPAPAVQAGVVPDLEHTDVLTALRVLKQAQINYLIVEVENDDVPALTVFDQTPAPGTEVGPQTVVTLLVSR